MPPLPIGTIQRRDNYICQYCGKDGLASAENWHDCVIDHFTPRKLGGADADDNLVTSCHYCNAVKGHRSFESVEAAKAYVTQRRTELQAVYEDVRKAVRGS